MTEEQDDTRHFEDGLSRLESEIGYRFKDRELLVTALQHSSYSHDKSIRKETAESNERLEFLGDSVIGLVVAHALYAAKPDWNEGELTRALHGLVDRGSLSQLARSLKLGSVLRLGRTERQSGGECKNSILADAMESVIGAMYLDGGLGVVSAFVQRVFADALCADAEKVARDPKTELQERAMAVRGEFPTYRVLHDTQLEGDDRRFSVEAWLCGEPLTQGVGRTKRGAEREAAQRALEEWVDDVPAEG